MKSDFLNGRRMRTTNKKNIVQEKTASTLYAQGLKTAAAEDLRICLKDQLISEHFSIYLGDKLLFCSGCDEIFEQKLCSKV